MLAGRVKLCWRVVLTKKLGGLRNQGAQEAKETKETKELRNEGTKELRNEIHQRHHHHLHHQHRRRHHHTLFFMISCSHALALSGSLAFML